MTAAAFEDAIAWAQAHETAWPRDPADPGGGWGLYANDPPPYNRLCGPVSPRGPVSGVVWRRGEVLAQWGEPQRVDLTFSVAKTYLALLAGVAFDRGLLPDVDEPVVARVAGIGFEGSHNSAITWRHLLQQTSEWEGSAFGIPDQVDRYRTVQYQPAPAGGRKGEPRPLQAPGTFWEYNDVRINQLSLALLHLFQRPLPEVFSETIMEPIGASKNWRWVGYDTSWVEVAGRRVQSVPGGTHWGGGVSIDSFDQVRVGGLMLDGGKSGGRQVLSSEWLGRMREPCEIAPFYGFLIWLNRNGIVFPSAPHDSFFAVGAGSSITWVDPTREAVTVVRWIDGAKADGLFARVGAAIDRL
ncbi:MAG TPA: serine hydrolase [Burkholderiaceae bacterium]|nr:serine hydrolase [Burkholderiaceae bacterium]